MDDTDEPLLERKRVIREATVLPPLKSSNWLTYSEKRMTMEKNEREDHVPWPRQMHHLQDIVRVAQSAQGADAESGRAPVRRACSSITVG